MAARNLTGKRIAVYARYSSDNQKESSIEDQVRECQEFIEDRGGKVLRVYKDAAISGASLHGRAGFDDLMHAAKTGAIDVVVTEDLSRISRDLGDSAGVFKRLTFQNVQLLGVADGFDSLEETASMHLAMNGFKNDAYLRDLSKKTARGLRGRALAKFSTGGLPYGYGSEPAFDAQGRQVGRGIVIVDEQANTVRRIFTDYLSGKSYAAIATHLNADKVPPPRSSVRRGPPGWGASTIREFLRNEHYTGAWTFGAKKWIKDPDTGKRVYRKRASDQVLHDMRPELRIVSQELWSAVQERLEAKASLYVRNADGSPKGKALHGRGVNYPFSGLLFCGSCGATMTIVGGAPRRYMCSAKHKRGNCANGATIHEHVIKAGLLGAIRGHLISRGGLSYARKRFAEALGAMSRDERAEVKEVSDRIARTEQRIKGLVSFIADGDESPAVRETLRDLEAQLTLDRSQLQGIKTRTSGPIRLPTEEDIKRLVFDLEAKITKDALRGRELLRTLFKDGKIVLDAQADGTYVAKSALLPLVLLAPNVKTPESNDSGASYTTYSCAGWI